MKPNKSHPQKRRRKKNPALKKIKNNLIYYVVLGYTKLLRRMERRSAIKLSRLLTRLAYVLADRERKRTIRQLTEVFEGEKSAREIRMLSRQVFSNLAACASDLLRMPILIRENLFKIVFATGLNHIEWALKRGKGAILLTAHFGNWELLGAYVVQCGIPLQVVGTTLYDPRLDEIIVTIRNQAGYTNLARGKATRNIIKAIKANYCIGFLIDQDTKVNGVFVNFFNKPAHTAVGPVALALKYDLPIIPVFIRLNEDLTYRIDCEGPLPLTRSGNMEEDLFVNTQRCSDVYEKIIRKYPEQWVWLHDRWKKKPETI